MLMRLQMSMGNWLLDVHLLVPHAATGVKTACAMLTALRGMPCHPTGPFNLLVAAASKQQRTAAGSSPSGGSDVVPLCTGVSNQDLGQSCTQSFMHA